MSNKLYAVGVDYDEWSRARAEGIDKFVASVDELLKLIGEKRHALADAA